MMRDTINHILERIDSAASRSGRNARDVRLMAVTKTKPAELIREAYGAGLRLFGENRVQEALSKYPGLPDDLELHLIGHLQRNKAKQAADLFSWVESIDKADTATALEKHSAESDKSMNILLEVNTSGEDSKSGFISEKDVYDFLESFDEYPHLKLRGLMTIGPYGGDEKLIRSSFRSLKNLFDSLNEELGEEKMDTLSMGMSSDFELAVEEGSTLVRVGTLLFGSRV